MEEPIRPAGLEDILYTMRVTIFIGLLCLGYSLSEPMRAGKVDPTEPSSAPPLLTPAQRQWSEKAVKHYADAQEKKWQRWNEAMFERTD